MKINARIINYAVLRDGISVQLVCDGKDSETPEKFTSFKDVSGYFTIGDMGAVGVVKSISLRKGVHILLHLDRKPYIVRKLFDLMERDIIPVTINSEQEKRLLYLLDKTSKAEDKPQKDLLRELTTFTGKNGQLVEGKESIYELSPRFQEVVIGKLLHKRENASVQENHGIDEAQSCAASAPGEYNNNA